MLELSLFAERLRRARTDKHFTQQELADSVGLSAATISYYEKINKKDGKMPTLDKVYAISEQLGVSIDWLCGKNTDENTNKFDYYGGCIKAERVEDYDNVKIAEADIVQMQHIAALMISGYKLREYSERRGRYYIDINKSPLFSNALLRLEKMTSLYISGDLPSYAFEGCINSLTDKYFAELMKPDADNTDYPF